MILFAPILARPAPFVRALLLAVAVLASSAANAEITLSPLRQVVSEASPVATYRVSNPSSRIVDGRIRLIDLAATETGYEEASAEQRSGLSAAPYLTVWPAHFRLEPGGSAIITVALKPGAAPPAGERRSHLLIETEAVRTPLRKAGGAPQLDVGLGMTTPVLLRGGAGEASAAIGETRLLRSPDGFLEIETHVGSNGEFSAYGRIDVMFTPMGKARSAATLLKRVENVAAYLDAPRRRVIAPLGVEQLPAGVLEIRYVGRAEFEGREFATRSFEIAAPR
jgi:hypothetical protein